MISINDRYSFGIISGIFANLLNNILDYIFYLIGINKYHMWQIAASAYLKIEDTKTIPALIIGAISDYSTAALMGVSIIYLLYFTGSENFWLKGMSIGGMWWLFAFGVILRAKIGRIDPIDIGTNLYHAAEHLLFGIIVAFIIVKYGKKLLQKQII